MSAEQQQATHIHIVPPVFNSPTNTPTHAFWMDDACQWLQQQGQQQQQQGVCGSCTVAYHGTTMEALHSILNVGLVGLSGTRLQRNGAMLGDGIYLR
jgi:hypothetical protein